MKTKLILPAIVYKDEDSDYGVHLLSLNGLFSSGKTVEKALSDVKSCIEGNLLWVNDDFCEDALSESFVGVFPVEVEIDFPVRKDVDKEE